ncbi:hypothetical protein Dimus_008300, partial [Dionaea muscipula]
MRNSREIPSFVGFLESMLSRLQKVKRKLLVESETVASSTVPSKEASQKEELEQRQSSQPQGEAN